MTALLNLDGHLTIDGELPDGDAVATVKVVDATGEILAATATDVTENPVPWSVSIDVALAPDPDALLVWAMVRSDEAVWGTPELRPAASPVTLVRVDGN